MDVIALHQAGFDGAVAPLGTALAEEQLELLWRLSPTPYLCFDGDAAGARAAARVMSLALPLLTAERSLLLATLPAGQDPDDLVRRNGPAGFKAVLDGARPLVDAMFDALREGSGETPEARAGFRRKLEVAAGQITDKALAGEYRSALLGKFFASRKGGKGKGAAGAARQRPRSRTPLMEGSAQAERARCLAAILLRHPSLLHDVEEAWASLPLPPDLDRLRDAILHLEGAQALDSAGLLAHLNASGLTDETAFVLSSAMPLPPSVRPEAMPAEAEGEWWHLFGLLRGLQRLDEEVADADRVFRSDQTEMAQRRLKGLLQARLDLVEFEAND